MGARHPRMILSTEGMEGSGKSRLALSAPGSIRYLDFDYGIEGVEGGDRADVDRICYNTMTEFGETEAQALRKVKAEMVRFLTDFKNGLGAFRNIVVDTFGAAWAGQRVANPKEDRSYAEMEEEFKSVLRMAFACPSTNVILIHHLKQDWARDSGGKSYRAKSWSRDGMDGIANAVQLAVRQRYIAPVNVGQLHQPGKFELDVLKCRDNVGLVGTTHENLDFVTLATLACPEVDWSK
jgi:hypothetical protein